MKSNWLTRTFAVSLPFMVVFVALALGATAVAQQANAESGGGRCSNRTLFGDYGMQIEGTLLAPNWPLRTVVKVYFDGRGNLTAVVYKVINGIPTYGDWTSEGSGTYTVNPDCTASAAFNGPIPVHFVVVNNGKDFLGVVDGNAITFVGSRVN